MADKITAGFHALFVTFPVQGHLTPSVNLAIQLAAHGFTVTFVHPQLIHRPISEEPNGGDAFFDDARAASLDIRCELIRTGIPVSDKTAAKDFLFNELPVHVENLIAKPLAGSPPVDLLVADTFYTWPSAVAEKFVIPYVSLWTETATVLSIYYHMDLLMANGHFASTENRKDTITYVPGVKPLDPVDLVSHLRETELTPTHHAFFKAFEGAKAAEFVIGNVVQELEEDTVAALQQKQRFYTVGPIFSGDSGSLAKTSVLLEHDCSPWLDSKPPGSVLYVSFGSLNSVSNKQHLEEIAYGVLGSKASFVWISRPSSANSGEANAGWLPEGFVEESRRGKGIVVPWCDQREVLKHPSIGGFLTHCGWNSILESIWCGVPMICYPLFTDQYTNRKLVVDDWMVGLDLERTGEVLRGKVSNTIDDLMGGSEAGAAVKKAAEDVQKVVRAAIAAGGSSGRKLEQFIVDLSTHIAGKHGEF